MLKLRLKRQGSKGQVLYRIVVMLDTSKRDGKPIEELGFYNPKTKELRFNLFRTKIRLNQGAHPTATVKRLFKKMSSVVTNIHTPTFEER